MNIANVASLAGLSLFVAQVASAQDEPPLPAPGPYQGVVPGTGARNPLPHPRSDPPRLIWTGFKMAGERSEIFLQTTRPVTHELGPAGKVAPKPGALSVVLRNCRIHLKNNARRIDTRFFATPVQGVSARQRRRDVEISIALKDAAAPDVRVDPGPDGTQFVVLSFGPGRAERAAVAPGAAPEPTPADPEPTGPPSLSPPSLSP